MSKVKKNTKKIVIPPYTTEQLLKEMKKYTSPLLSKQKIFRKWCLDIVEFMKLYKKETEYIEEVLSTKRDNKFYINNMLISI